MDNAIRLGCIATGYAGRFSLCISERDGPVQRAMLAVSFSPASVVSVALPLPALICLANSVASILASYDVVHQQLLQGVFVATIQKFTLQVGRQFLKGCIRWCKQGVRAIGF